MDQIQKAAEERSSTVDVKLAKLETALHQIGEYLSEASVVRFYLII